ncbi:orotidine-5'-phosphate decarboxylase [Acaricomes phytoseiuli]|uniref:orotidine-5'-phosphate decarboxylase n=1 Tax=Acaricomes phytoseiuli TaxID=291968 RepID=UPI000365973B|nr:orotidine-5'-phosphate decarboxylase [Acaricomes phytoseiuli]MCW1249145.1 orotidine-5'-phosphate decarboxylase [Acaricomes phytoseiuli]
MPENFGRRLAEAMSARGRLCLGIDPHPEQLRQWGLNDDAASAERFARTLIEAGVAEVPAVKPQIAFFERFGAAGYTALERVLADAHQAGLLTVADAKRGDIGSTMAGYAEAWFAEGSPLRVDALTVSPYLGFGSLRPVLDLAIRNGRGVFVLALTSNPEGMSVQHRGSSEPEGAVARGIVAAAVTENQTIAGDTGEMGPVGLVVGATIGSAAEDLDLRLESFNGPILAPGLGAQGADADELRTVFGRAYAQVLAPASRLIAAAGPEPAAIRELIRKVSAELA